MATQRHHNNGLRKICNGSRRQWAKCPHVRVGFGGRGWNRTIAPPAYEEIWMSRFGRISRESAFPACLNPANAFCQPFNHNHVFHKPSRRRFSVAGQFDSGG